MLHLNMSVLQQPVQPLDVFVLHQPKLSCLWTCLSNTSPAYDVSDLKASCAAQTCLSFSCLVLPLDVPVLQQLCCLWGLDMSVLQQPVISLDVSVLQHPLLPFDTSVLQLFTVCTLYNRYCRTDNSGDRTDLSRDTIDLCLETRIQGQHRLQYCRTDASIGSTGCYRTGTHPEAVKAVAEQIRSETAQSAAK